MQQIIPTSQFLFNYHSSFDLFNLISFLPKQAYRMLRLLKQDRDIAMVEYTERPLSYYVTRMGVCERTVRRAFRFLELLGFAGRMKGVGGKHVSRRWITEAGYLWADGKMSDVILPLPYIDLFSENKTERDLIIREHPSVDKSTMESAFHKLISLCPTRYRQSIKDAFIASSLPLERLFDLTKRILLANKKNPIERIRAYFLAALANEEMNTS